MTTTKSDGQTPPSNAIADTLRRLYSEKSFRTAIDTDGVEVTERNLLEGGQAAVTETTVCPVITDQTGNGIVYTRRLTEREFDGGISGLEWCDKPGTAESIGKWSWASEVRT
jgi:hypothetical protein